MAAALGLAACDGGDIAGLGAAGLAFSRAAPQRVAVADGSIVITGPRGFCIDRSALREDSNGAFVLLGSCASITQSAGQPQPAIPAILTATVSGNTVEDAGTDELLGFLEAYLKSDDGLATLSRSGDPDKVQILETMIRDGALYIHARDRSGLADEISSDYWRALLGINGRIVTISVVGFDRIPMSSTAGFQTLNDFKARIRAANGA